MGMRELRVMVGGLLFLALEAGCMGVLTLKTLEVYTFWMIVLFSVYAVVQ